MSRWLRRCVVLFLAVALIGLSIAFGPTLVHFAQWQSFDLEAPEGSGEWSVEQHRFSSRLVVRRDDAWISTSSAGEPDHLVIFNDGWAIRVLRESIEFHRAPNGEMPELDPPAKSVSRISRSR